ncbi:MAG: MFS transporter [Thermoproteus sp.]
MRDVEKLTDKAPQWTQSRLLRKLGLDISTEARGGAIDIYGLRRADVMRLFPYVLASRAVYALLWFYIAPILPIMAKELSATQAELGLLPAAFIAGAAAAQIPASWLGSKIGDVRTAGLGLLLLGAGSASLGLAGTWAEALAFRAVAGVGAGLFFSTAGAALVALRPRAVGSALGLYNASFNLGALAGYYWGYVAGPLGWRNAVIAPGAVAAAMSVPLLAQGGFKHQLRLSRSAASLGLASFPIWGAAYAANSLAASWLELYRGASPSAAGAMSSASMASGLLGGLLGVVYDRTSDKRLVLASSALATAASMAVIPWAPTPLAPAAIFAYGTAYTVYMTSIYAEGSASGDPSSALAVINLVDMALGLNMSYAFSYAMALSPPLAWSLAAAAASTSASAALLAGSRKRKT